MTAQSFERFFLEEAASQDAFFRAPRRLGCEVEPLLDRATAFQAMEQAVLAAAESIHMAGWVFFPETPLLDAAVRKATGGRTWLDLLGHVITTAGVKVRVLITDFDPFFEPRNHRLCWSSLAALVKLRDRLPADRRERLECMGSLHDYSLTPSFVTLGLFSLDDQIDAVIAEYNRAPFAKSLKTFLRTPGHWASIAADEKKRKFVAGASPETRAFPASHHQKFCCVDGQVAFCGGMDLTPLALDTPDHKRRRHPFKRGEFDLSWHDIQARIAGPVVDDIERAFRERWNVELAPFITRLTGFAAIAPPGALLPVPALTQLKDLGNRAARTPGRAAVQLLRTVSLDKSGQLLPDLKRMDVLESYGAAIDAAKEYVYFENQYFRSSEIVEMIIARHKAVPQLQCIVVLPIAPEELTSRASADPKALHPIAVQIEQIERLSAALGPNFGIFSLVVRARSNKKSFTDAFGSPQLYVHSKIAIVDDQYATIGSANVNGRSFRMDTELNIGWVHPADVRAFRLRLWKHLLGTHAGDMASWSTKSFVTRWRTAAARNTKQPPATRGGLVIPHDNALLKDIAKKMPLIPEVFINIDDLLPEAAPLDLIERDEAQDEPRPAVS
jgi:phospholipase D1/2